jgi:predicted nucleic acid-binding protein
MEVLGAEGVGVFVMGADHLARLATLMRQYADLPMDLADASLVLLAEEYGEGRIISTDERDFHAYRWKNQHPFRNLLLEQG